MKKKQTQGKYRFDSLEFMEREQFFKKTLNIDVRSYFHKQDGEMTFNRTKLYNDILSKTLDAYYKADSSLFPKDFNIQDYMKKENEDGTDTIQTSVYAFNRQKLHEMATAKDTSIEDWLKKDFKAFSDNVIALKDKPRLDKIASVIAHSGLLAVTPGTIVSMDVDYGYTAPMATVPLEEEAEAEVVESICTSLKMPGVIAAVIVVAAAIATLIIVVSVIDRDLSAEITNDTKQDFYIEDIYMKHGEMTTKFDKENKIPGKKSDNIASTINYTIEKSVGFYGAECTMRLKSGSNSYYYLSANPLSEKSRVNLILQNDGGTESGHHKYSSRELHQQLYDTGKKNIKKNFDNICFDIALSSEHGSKNVVIFNITEIVYDHGDFTKENPEYRGTLSCVGSNKFRYDKDKGYFEVLPGGYCNFHVKTNGEDVSYILEMKTSDANGAQVMCYYGRQETFLVKNTEFSPYTFVSLYDKKKEFDKGSAIIEIENQSNHASLYLKKIAVEHSVVPKSSDWMKGIDDSVHLEDINIPGTHDAAAIRKYYKGYDFTAGLYVCHTSTITEQLNGGIRLLDIRIKIKKENKKFYFMTCHGSIGGSTTINEFQTLSSLLDECKDFLTNHPKETLICTFKIDDEGNYEETELKIARDQLEQLLRLYPIRSYQKKLGTLGECRGKIIAFNRINEEKRFGYPIHWSDNTQGEYASEVPIKDYDESSEREFKVFVQDHYQYGVSLDPDKQKYNLVISIIDKKVAGDNTVFLNYASACYASFLGVYITDKLVNYFGQKVSLRPKHLGWIFLDFEFNAYTTNVYSNMNTVSLIIDSNFNYKGCAKEFHIVYKKEDL